MIVHSRFVSVDLHDDDSESNAMIIGRYESALIIPADIKLYNIIGKGWSGVQYIPFICSCPRKPRDASIRREVKQILQKNKKP